MYSLKKNLNRSLLVNIILVMLLLLIVLNFMIQKLVEDHVLTRLQHDAESLISLIRQDEYKRWNIDPAHISTIYNRVRSGHYYVVKTPQKILRSRSLFDFEVNLEDSMGAQPDTFQIPGPGDENWLVWQQLFYKNDMPVQVWVAEDIAPLYDSLHRFSLYALMIVSVFTVISLYIQHRIMDRGFHVFEVLRRNLRAIGDRETTNNEMQLPLEVLPLVKEIEQLVKQLSLRIQRTRNAIANLSHEIRRPLQFLKLNSDVGNNEPAVPQALDEIQKLVDRELKRATVSGSSLAGGVFHINEDMPYLIEMMQKIYPRKRIEMKVQQDMDSIHHDRDDMLELIGNLLDNACKFASEEVILQVKQSTDELLFVFDDDGDGVEPGMLNNIKRKGFRLDESIQGHGLGLSICADIIDSYQGQLEFGYSELGGLKVEVRLPAH